MLASAGEILLAQQHERLHEPLEGGGSSYRRTVPLDPRFTDAVTSLLRALRYTGIAMFEFKGDPTNGEWILVEINGRFWESLPLSLSAGIDFPYALWELLMGGRTQVRNEYRVNVFGRNVKRDLKWLWLNLRADRSDPALATRDLSTVAGELSNMVSGREHTDQFTVDDPAPGMVELGELGLSFWDHLRTFVLEHSPLRWCLRRRARAALRSARTVIFVCYSNICRSSRTIIRWPSPRS